MVTALSYVQKGMKDRVVLGPTYGTTAGNRLYLTDSRDNVFNFRFAGSDILQRLFHNFDSRLENSAVITGRS